MGFKTESLNNSHEALEQKDQRADALSGAAGHGVWGHYGEGEVG